MRKYDYEKIVKFIKENSKCILLEKEYKNNTTKMLFKCNCGNEFKTSFKEFKQLGKRQCNCCGYKKSNEDKIYNIEFVRKYISQFNCKLLSEEYINCKTKLNIKCSCGRVFTETFDSFKNSKRTKCRECESRDSRFKKGQKPQNKKTHEEFIKQIQEKYGDEYEFLSEYKRAKDKIKIKHKCGYIYETRAENIATKGNRCPNCYDIKNSKLSKDVEKWLNENDIFFIKEKKFKDCIYKRHLSFDFFIPDKNLCIEVDGQQHFEPFRYIKDINKRLEKFNLGKLRDKIKDNYCKENNIQLIRIPYFEIKNINTILSNIFK